MSLCLLLIVPEGVSARCVAPGPTSDQEETVFKGEMDEAGPQGVGEGKDKLLQGGAIGRKRRWDGFGAGPGERRSRCAGFLNGFSSPPSSSMECQGTQKL